MAIKIKEKNKGKFTAWAKAHGMSVQQAARHVLRNREKYSSTLIKRANFARNASKWEEGGLYLYPELNIPTKYVRGKEFNADNIPAYATGGEVVKSKSKLNVANNNWIPITERNFYDRAIKPYNDTLTLGQYYATPPQERSKYIPNNKFKIEQGKKGSTANQGYMQYFHNEPMPMGPRNSLNMTPTAVIPEFAAGGFMQALSGAASVLGPIGSIAQAGLGIVNMFGQRAQRKEEERLARLEQERNIDASQNMGQSSLYNHYIPTFKVGGSFKGKKFGGKPNAEVEGGEVIITPDGTQTNMRGPSHSGGGIDVQLPNESLIISKKYAKEVMPYTSKINKAKEIIDGGGTKLAKNSSKRNLNKYYSKVLDTYNKQEANKLKKFEGGGPYEGLKYVAPEEEVMDLDFIFNNPNAEKQYNIKFSNPKDDPTSSSFDGRPLGQKRRDRWNTIGDVASSVGELAPTLYNLFAGRPKDIDENRYKNYNAGKISSLMADRTYNIDAGLAGNEASYRTNAANIRNLGGSRGQIMSNLTGAQNAKMFADMALRGDKSNIENQYRGDYANMLYGLGRDDMSGRMAHDEAEAMDMAAWRNMKGSAMTGLQQYLLTRRQMKNQASRDKLLAKAIGAYSPYASKWVPGIDEYIND